MRRARRHALAVVAAALAASIALDASAQTPPRSCASKFVGLWRNPAGGSNWIETRVHANGTATPVCVPAASCYRVQYWTCDGNSYRFSNFGHGAYTFEASLSPDGSRLVTGGIVAVRAGRARR